MMCACSVVCVCFVRGGVWCVVCVCWCVCVLVCVLCVCGGVCVCVLCVARLGTRKNPVCRFKTSACVHSKHGDVLNLHAGSLSLSLSSPFFFLSSFVLFLFSPLPVTMTMITRSVGSLCTQSSDLPECQCAWASVHSLLGEHVRIMQETTVLVKLCKPRATWNEVGLYVRWK